MKKYFILILCISAVLFSSCKKDEETKKSGGSGGSSLNEQYFQLNAFNETYMEETMNATSNFNGISTNANLEDNVGSVSFQSNIHLVQGSYYHIGQFEDDFSFSVYANGINFYCGSCSAYIMEHEVGDRYLKVRIDGVLGFNFMGGFESVPFDKAEFSVYY